MRHRKKGKRLGRDAAHRKALLRNLSDSLVVAEKIETTLAKAKYLRPYFEKLVTKAKKGTESGDKLTKFNAIKYLNGKLTTKEAVKKLLEDVAPRFKNTIGGYTRIIRIGERKGDNAQLARIELTIFSDTKKPAKKGAKSKIKAEVKKPKKKEDTGKKPQKKAESKKPVKVEKKKTGSKKVKETQDAKKK